METRLKLPKIRIVHLYYIPRIYRLLFLNSRLSEFCFPGIIINPGSIGVFPILRYECCFCCFTGLTLVRQSPLLVHNSKIFQVSLPRLLFDLPMVTSSRQSPRANMSSRSRLPAWRSM